MSVVGVTLAVRTALASAITAGGLTCRKYDTWDVPDGNIATLGLLRWQLMEGADQAYGFQGIVVPVLVYQVVNGSIDDSLGYQESNVEKVIDGLSADRTLGGKVADSDVGNEATQSFYRITGGATYSVAELDVSVIPFRNVG